MKWQDKLTRHIVKELRETLDNILKDNERLEQFNVTVGNASFNDDEATFKLNIRVKGAKSQSEKDLELYGNMHNLDLEKVSKIDGKTFKLSGFRRKARSKPYLIKQLGTDKEYIITTEVAKKYFSKENAIHIGDEV
jgi:23S rRNA A1618 N6-methylase RlmF